MEDVLPVKKIPPLLESGDILFYKMNGSFTDRIIKWYTKSPYVHVSIALDNKNQIEARAHGVIRTVIDRTRLGAVFHLNDGYQIGKNIPMGSKNELTKALVWLNMQVGREYSWADIVNAVAERWYQRMYLVQVQHYDCSALAAEFLTRAGYKLLLWPYAPQQITPAILASRLRKFDGWKQL